METGKYRHLIIKEYEHWALFLSEKQMPYVGRCYAWWRDTNESEGEGMSLTDLSPKDLIEVLHMVYGEVVVACKALGYPTHLYGTEFLLNTTYLANEEAHNHHMHWHFIPRAKTPVEVRVLPHRRFEDLLWGANYANIKQVSLRRHELLIVRDAMASAIGGIP
jgi:hypothetical protein